jgi:hypothetical protein
MLLDFIKPIAQGLYELGVQIQAGLRRLEGSLLTPPPCLEQSSTPQLLPWSAAPGLGSNTLLSCGVALPTLLLRVGLRWFLQLPR